MANELNNTGIDVVSAPDVADVKKFFEIGGTVGFGATGKVIAEAPADRKGEAVKIVRVRKYGQGSNKDKKKLGTFSIWALKGDVDEAGFWHQTSDLPLEMCAVQQYLNKEGDIETEELFNKYMGGKIVPTRFDAAGNVIGFGVDRKSGLYEINHKRATRPNGYGLVPPTDKDVYAEGMNAICGGTRGGSRKGYVNPEAIEVFADRS